MDESVIILAGGESKRFGFPKAFLPFDCKQSFIEIIIETYLKYICDEIILVLNINLLSLWDKLALASNPAIIIVLNEHPERERFYSIKIGIDKLRSNTHYCFLQNADNPFVTSSVLKDLSDARNENSYTLSVLDGKGTHPILIGKDVIEFIRKLSSYNYNLRDILKRFARREVQTNNKKLLANINTEEEYKLFFTSSLLAGK